MPSVNDRQRGPQEERSLNVTDALKYLDDIKAQFANQPEVYNRFLDVMKDFKSDKIETLEVVRRVSDMFKDHPSLVRGLNTFLPDGYRVDCTPGPNNVNVVTVVTPSTRRKGGRKKSPTSPTTSDLGRVEMPGINHADGYLQKIKSRCDPETYRQFVDILSKGTFNPGETEKQIDMLFKDSPEDLRQMVFASKDRNV